MKLSLSNGIFRNKTLGENIAEVKRLGFENLEFNMKCVETQDDTSIYEAKKLVDASGLACPTLHVGALHVKDPIEAHRAVYYGKISLDFARALNTPVMVIHSNIARKLPYGQRQGMLKAIFGELSPYAKELSIKLALENLSYASSGYGKNVREIEEILGIIDHDDSLGFTLDFCHGEATGQTFALLEKYHTRLCNVHISNRAHRPFETETDRLCIFIEKLREAKYNGPITMELSHKCTTEQILKTKSILEELIA